MSKLNEYVRSLEEAIQPSPVIRTYEIHIDRKTEDLVYINVKIDFEDGSILDFKEFIAATRGGIEKYKYAYNYRKHGTLMFRYDNASDPRARKLLSFPHHVHLPSNEIAESLPMDTHQILALIEDIMIEKAY